MTVSPLGWIVGLGFLLAYIIVHVLKTWSKPNLGDVFVLFIAGPVVDQAFDVIWIVYRLVVAKEEVDVGVFEPHVYPIAFTAVALLYAVVDTAYGIFSGYVRRPSSRA